MQFAQYKFILCNPIMQFALLCNLFNNFRAMQFNNATCIMQLYKDFDAIKMIEFL